jgi:hypothetical protein
VPGEITLASKGVSFPGRYRHGKPLGVFVIIYRVSVFVYG